jgi:mRNA interferase MazF
VRRGEIWTAAGGPDYAGKPRPVLIVQDDRFEDLPSVTTCPFTTDPREAAHLRVAVQPDERNGLRIPSSLMVDKIGTIPRAKLGARVGMLAPEDLAEVNRAMTVFLGLAAVTKVRSGAG